MADQPVVTSLVPATGDGFDLPESLDDLLPSTAPQDRQQAAPAAPAPVAAVPAQPPREPTPDDIAAIAVLHDEVNQASEAAERSPFGGKGRKRLKAALRAEDEALGALGFASHAEFVFATQAGTLPPPHPDDFWGGPGSASRETLANLNTIAPEPVAAVDETDAVHAELEQAHTDLAHAHAEVQRMQDELNAANAARRAGDELQAQTRAELDELTAWHHQADADLDDTRRKLAAAEQELERIRAELGAAKTAPVTDEAAFERMREESEQEIARIRTLAASEIEDLAAKLEAYEAEAGRVAAANEQKHRDDLERFETELRAATEAAARAGAETADATRSRDAAIDELARHRTEIDKLRSELGTTRADVSRWEDACAAAMVRVAEAEAAVGSAREDSDRDVVRLDALTKQQEAELAELRAQLGQASTDANAFAMIKVDLAKVTGALETAQHERAAAIEGLEQLRAELASAQHDLAAARDAVTTARAEADRSRAEIEDIRAEVTTLETAIEERNSRPVPAPEPAAEPEPTRELRRLVEVAREMAKGTDHRARPRIKAEQELAELEADVEELRAKRRRAKKRLEREQSQLRNQRERLKREFRDAEAARDRVRYETEALAARVANEAASVLDEALRRRRDEERARDAELERAAAAVAALEAGATSVAVDADALRSKLSLMRANLLVEGRTAPRPGGHD